MKHFLIVTISFLLYFNSSAQIIDVNPNIKWTYVRSQDLDLQNGSVYKYEFPAEKGYDYIFNMFYEETNFVSYLKVLNMQLKPVAAKTDSISKDNTNLTFRVSESGTYYIVLGYNSKAKDMLNLATKFSLIRRPRVD